MNKMEFGLLVSALRKEHRDTTGKIWTQAQLASATHVSKRTIERLETGTLHKLDADLLLRLANALHLTTIERKEFFFAAIGIDDHHLPAPDKPLTSTYAHIADVIATIGMPAFVIDNYGEVILINSPLIAIWGLEAFVHEHQPPVGTYNFMRAIFDPISPYPTLIGAAWSTVAQQNMQLFRGITFRYRVDPRFSQILAVLRTYPRFQHYWDHAYLAPQDSSGEGICYTYTHPTFGPLRYLANVATTRMPTSEYYTIVYNPLTEHTDTIFRQLRIVIGTTVNQLNSWQ